MEKMSDIDDEAVVSFVCKRTVVSTKPVSPGKYFPLSVLDRLMERNHLMMVFYYPPPHPMKPKAAGGHSTSTSTTTLRESLAETLTQFPAMTGRLKRDDGGQWTVKCNDAGVRMVEARAKGSVEDWLKCVDREKELKLVHWEEMYHKPYFWSTFYVQLTEFEDGGLAIGLSCIHLLSDPTSAIVFLNSWAQTTFFGKTMSPSNFHDYPLSLPQRNEPSSNNYTSNLIDHYKSTIERSESIPTGDNTNYTTVSLLFSDDKVKELISHLSPVTSAFEALCGLFWVCISRAKGVSDGRLVDMSVCVDARDVLGLDDRFFGNCMVYSRVRSEGLRGDDAAGAATRVAGAVAEVDGEAVAGLIEWIGHNCDGTTKLPLMNGCDLVCAALGHAAADPYAAAFGDGAGLARVSCYVEPGVGLGQVIVLQGPPREGPLSRVVMVTLPRDEVTKLCGDDLLLSFSPTLLMGPGRV